MKKFVILFIIIIIILIGIITYIFFLKEENIEKVEFYFFPFADADACLITYKNSVIIIDTGEDKNQEKLQKELEKRKINKIDYLILTHPDKDHIGNAKFLIENYTISSIYQNNFNKGSELQDTLNKTIEETKLNNIIITKELEIKINNLIIKIEPPNADYEDSNNNSLLVTIEFNNKKALFAGDIKEERIRDILENLQEVDLLKFPYHGRKNELSAEFIQKLKPKYTVITGTEPDNSIIEELHNVNSKIRYTNEQSVEIIFE